MKLVLQQYSADCFPACLSMITGWDLEECYRVTDGRKTVNSWKNKGTSQKQERRAFLKSGLVAVKRKRKFDKGNDAVLVCELEDGCYHAVVWDAERKKILDPLGKKNACSKKYYFESIRRVYEIFRRDKIET